MQFQVPQFIEMEDKIFGPLTFKQFVYVAGGLGTMYIVGRILPLIIAAPIILAIAVFAGSLAFLEWNGRPLSSALENAFFYFFGAKLYIWSNKERGEQKGAKEKRSEHSEGKSLVYVPRLSESKLHDLAWSLDIKERIAEGEAPQGRIDEMAPIRSAQEARV